MEQDMKQGMEQDKIRINKYLSEAGLCSRREADRQIAAGNVLLDGAVAQMGQTVREGQEVIFCGKKVQKKAEPVLLAFHKPRGVVCTTAKAEKNNIVDFLNYPLRVYPVGRLDKESDGLILMSNQGDLANQILKESHCHEKEYQLVVDKAVTPEFIRRMSGGVYLKDLHRTTRKCLITQTGERSFQIILTQGLNRQIRRMCECLGYRVTRLTRTRILNICLGDLAAGQYREVTKAEGEELKSIL